MAADRVAADAHNEVVSIDSVGTDRFGVDNGPKTTQTIQAEVMLWTLWSPFPCPNTQAKSARRYDVMLSHTHTRRPRSQPINTVRLPLPSLLASLILPPARMARSFLAFPHAESTLRRLVHSNPALPLPLASFLSLLPYLPPLHSTPCTD